jgi:hypothetical protein
MPEKTKFLNAAADNDYYLFLEHDAQKLLLYNILKRIRLKEVFKADEILNSVFCTTKWVILDQ